MKFNTDTCLAILYLSLPALIQRQPRTASCTAITKGRLVAVKGSAHLANETEETFHSEMPSIVSAAALILAMLCAATLSLVIKKEAWPWSISHKNSKGARRKGHNLVNVVAKNVRASIGKTAQHEIQRALSRKAGLHPDF